MGGMELGVWRCGGGTRRSWERRNFDQNVLYEKIVFNKNINSTSPFHFVDISGHVQLTHHEEYSTTLKWGIFFQQLRKLQKQKTLFLSLRILQSS